jgi:hypothetical protein
MAITIIVDLDVGSFDKSTNIQSYVSNVTLKTIHKGELYTKDFVVSVSNPKSFSKLCVIKTLTKCMSYIKNKNLPVVFKFVGNSKSDIDYAVTCLNYLAYWVSNDWRKKDGKPVMNQEALQELYYNLPTQYST